MDEQRTWVDDKGVETIMGHRLVVVTYLEVFRLSTGPGILRQQRVLVLVLRLEFVDTTLYLYFYINVTNIQYSILLLRR